MQPFSEEEITGILPAPAQTEMPESNDQQFDILQTSALLARGTLFMGNSLVIGCYLHMPGSYCYALRLGTTGHGRLRQCHTQRSYLLMQASLIPFQVMFRHILAQ